MLSNELRYSARHLIKTPGITLIVVMIMALGIGATTTVFSVIDAVLLRSLPYGNPERLVYMWTPVPRFKGVAREIAPPYADLFDWRKMSHSFAGITALERKIVLVGGERPQRFGAAMVMDNFFQTLDVTPELGHAIDVNDLISQQRVALISDALWRSMFDGDANVLGRTIEIDGQSYRVEGVVPKQFAYPHGSDFPSPQFATLKRTDIWIPLALPMRQAMQRPDPSPEVVIGRLRPGVRFDEAQAEMAAIEKRLAPLYPPEFRDVQSLLVPLIETAVEPVRPLLRLILGAVVFVLLMACANVASLLLSRVAGRLHEIAIRAALGAERTRLIRLMLTESVMLAVLGGTVGAVLSVVALKAIVKLNPGDIPRFEEAGIDKRVLLSGLLVSVGTGLASGIFPALTGSFINVGEWLRQGGRGIVGDSYRTRSALVVVDVALAVVLLAGAGLLIRSYLVLQGEEKGFSPSTLTLSLNLDERTRKPEQLNILRREAMDRIRALSGISVAGSIDDLPLSRAVDATIIEVQEEAKQISQVVNVRQTAGEYFQAMQIPLLAGRLLKDSDIPVPLQATFNSVVVTEILAKLYLGGVDKAVGRRIRFGERWITVVGVVGDVRDASLEQAPQPTLYWQCGLADSVVIRTAMPINTVISSVRRAIGQIAPDSSLTDVRFMGAYIADAAARRRFQTVALAAFSSIAVLLALAGLYGLLSYTIRQRTAEIGIRMVVGASRGAVAGMVIRYGLTLAAAGVAIGLALAVALTRVMSGLLYGIDVVDPITFVAVPVLLLGMAVMACVAPAYKAAGIDPMNALRHQ